MPRLVGHRIGEDVVLEVPESHRPHAQAVEVSQDVDAVADQMAAFETGQRGDLPGFVNTLDVAAGVGDLHVLGVAFHFLVQGIDHVESARQP